MMADNNEGNEQPSAGANEFPSLGLPEGMLIVPSIEPATTSTKFALQSIVSGLPASVSSRLLVPTADGAIYLPCEGIIRLHADGSYTHIFTENGERHLTCKGLGDMHRQLPVTCFHRCHHAHVINLRKVRKLISTGGHRAQMLTGDLVEVSRRRWRALLDAMRSLQG